MKITQSTNHKTIGDTHLEYSYQLSDGERISFARYFNLNFIAGLWVSLFPCVFKAYIYVHLISTRSQFFYEPSNFSPSVFVLPQPAIDDIGVIFRPLPTQTRKSFPDYIYSNWSKICFVELNTLLII